MANCFQLFAQNNPDSTLIYASDSISPGNNFSDRISHPDSMRMVVLSKKEGGIYKQNGRTLSRFEMVRILKSNPKAHRVMVYSRVCYWVMAPIAFCLGGVICVLPFVLFNSHPRWELGVVALCMAAVAVPLSYASDKLHDKAINIYNGQNNNK